jgi:indole-3-glycerol phosphate synthase
MKPTDYLNQILEKKKEEVSHLYHVLDFDIFLSQVNAIKHTSFLFSEMLTTTKLHLIAELKKASPSKGLINSDFSPKLLAKQYQKWGASCLSVLTEQHFFQGHLDHVKAAKNTVPLPILRKDFIVDPIQVLEAKAIGAHAILIILAILDQDTAQSLLTLAIEIGLDTLIETHNESEMERALQLKGDALIGINNRNLSTFNVDIQTALQLKQKFQSQLKSKKVIAESGYTNREELSQLYEAGFSGVLIGEGLITNPDMANYWGSKGE